MPVDLIFRNSTFRVWTIAILAGGILLAGLFSAQLSAQSDATGMVETDGRRLNARSGPGTDFAIVEKLEPATQVQIIEASADGAWLRIQANGFSGELWVSAEYIATGTSAPQQPAANPAAAGQTQSSDDTPGLLPTPTPAPAQESGTTNTSASASGNNNSETGRLAVRVVPLNLQNLTGRIANRTGLSASTEDDAAGANTVDDTLDDTADNTTALAITVPDVDPPGTTAPDTTAPDTTTPVASPTPAPTPSVPTAFTQPARMNVRSGPGTNFEIVTSVAAGTGLEIIAANPAGDWYQVSVSGQDEPAWIFASLSEAHGPIDAIARLSEDELPTPPEPVAVELQVASTEQADPAAPAPASAPAPAPVVAAPPPSGGVPFGYGVQAHMLGGGSGREMAAVSDLGFNWIKQQIQWKLFEPSHNARGFGELHGIVSEAGNRGINVLVSVVDAPDWAREPGFDGSVGGPPADPQTYANFVRDMAAQFCGTSLKAIEVWNEQNLHYEWGNLPLSPADYMNLLRPAYAAIKEACPSMYVISGALTPAGSNPPYALDDFQYLEGMYQNGLANYADGIGAHPSGYNVPPSVTYEGACAAIQEHGNSFNGACDSPHHSWSFRSTMEGYRNIMMVYGDANKKIWPTEFGWAAGGAFDPRYAYANDNSYEEQAAWTVEAYQMMKTWGWVGPAILWNLNFRVVADGTEKAQWGIVANNWEPLPIYNALKAMPK